jgi:hypothetical protein
MSENESALLGLFILLGIIAGCTQRTGQSRARSSTVPCSRGSTSTAGLTPWVATRR